MYVCLSLCVSVCEYVCVSVSLCVYSCVHARDYVYICVSVCLCECAYVSVSGEGTGDPWFIYFSPNPLVSRGWRAPFSMALRLGESGFGKGLEVRE